MILHNIDVEINSSYYMTKGQKGNGAPWYYLLILSITVNLLGLTVSIKHVKFAAT